MHRFPFGEGFFESFYTSGAVKQFCWKDLRTRVYLDLE